jgi:hypothetical protein
VGSSEFAEAGALIGYGVDFLDMCLKVAKSLGLTMPTSILLRPTA